MGLSRRQFLKLCAASSGALGLSQLWVPQIAQAFQKAIDGGTPIIWLQGSLCNGCTSSVLNTVHPEMKALLTRIINLSYHPKLASFGNPMVTAKENKNNYILIVEGAIPKANNGVFATVGEDSEGNPITLIDLVKTYGAMASTVIALGTCAAFGGAAAMEPNDGFCVGLDNIIGQEKVINIPGCPPHPDWILGTLSHVLLYGKPEVDDFGRPKMFYKDLIHNNCPRRQYFDNSIFAEKFGDEGCMLYLGCKGPLAFGDCPTRLWNNGAGWCISANSPCIGCTEPDFPEITLPFYKRMPEVSVPGINASADKIGLGMGIATATGIAVHYTSSYIAGRTAGKSKTKQGTKQDQEG